MKNDKKKDRMKTQFLTVKVTPVFQEFFRVVTDTEGYTHSDYVREAIIEKMKKDGYKPPK